MRIQVTKDTMHKLLVTRTYLTALGQFLELLHSVASKEKIENQKLGKQTKAVLNKIATYMQSEVSEHYKLYQALVVPIAKENDYELTKETGVTFDLVTDEIILDELGTIAENTEVVN